MIAIVGDKQSPYYSYSCHPNTWPKWLYFILKSNLTSTGYTGLQKTASSKLIYIQMLKSWQNQQFFKQRSLLGFTPCDPNHGIPTLVEVMTQCQTVTKPLHEPNINQIARLLKWPNDVLKLSYWKTKQGISRNLYFINDNWFHYTKIR